MERIDFSTVPSRVQNLLPTIRKILDSSIESEFLTIIRNKTISKTAAAPMTRINSFKDSQPGYYGPHGANIISDCILSNLADEIRLNEMLYEQLKFCGGVVGYISSVLVPEVGLCLIMEDFNVLKPVARQIMKGSIAYGRLVGNIAESDDDSDIDDDSEC